MALKITGGIGLLRPPMNGQRAMLSYSSASLSPTCSTCVKASRFCLMLKPSSTRTISSNEVSFKLSVRTVCLEPFVIVQFVIGSKHFQIHDFYWAKIDRCFTMDVAKFHCKCQIFVLPDLSVVDCRQQRHGSGQNFRPYHAWPTRLQNISNTWYPLTNAIKSSTSH